MTKVKINVLYLMSIYSDTCEIGIQSLPDWFQAPPDFPHTPKLTENIFLKKWII